MATAQPDILCQLLPTQTFNELFQCFLFLPCYSKKLPLQVTRTILCLPLSGQKLSRYLVFRSINMEKEQDLACFCRAESLFGSLHLDPNNLIVRQRVFLAGVRSIHHFLRGTYWTVTVTLSRCAFLV